jgi:cytochrome oxidase Cu insertion factor (SCO1/SenC/PrrC family)
LKLQPLIFVSSLMLLFSSLTACSSGNPTKPSTTTTKITTAITSTIATTSTEETGVEIGDKAPDFSIKDLEGNIVSSSDLTGKPVMLTFWGIG